MITAKITSKAQEGTNVRYWFQILKDGAVFAEGLSVLRSPDDTEDFVKSQIFTIKERYAKAEEIAEQEPDSLINLEL